MSQQHQDNYLNEGQPAQDTERKDHASDWGEEASIGNEAIAEEQLSSEELDDVSGGADGDFSDPLHPEVSHHGLGRAINSLEPGPTFPAPPRLEDSL